MAMGPGSELNVGAVRSRRCCGSIIVETAFIIPLLVLFIAGTFVIGMRLCNYMYLSQIARELVVKGGTIPGLAQGGTGQSTYTLNNASAPAGATVTACETAIATFLPLVAADNSLRLTSPDDTCPQTLLHDYGINLVEARNMPFYGDVTMYLTFGPHPDDATAATGLCFVTITLNVHDDGWLNYFSGDLNVNSRGPYVLRPVPEAGASCELS